MYHYIQGNKSNEWIPAIESQINVLNEILKTKQDIIFTITDPVSNKSFEFGFRKLIENLQDELESVVIKFPKMYQTPLEAT